MPAKVILMPAFVPAVTVLPTVNENVAVVAVLLALEASVTARLARPMAGNVPTDEKSMGVGGLAFMLSAVKAPRLAKAA